MSMSSSSPSSPVNVVVSQPFFPPTVLQCPPHNIQFHCSQRPPSSSLQLQPKTSRSLDGVDPAISIPPPFPSPSPAASSWMESIRSKTRSNLFREAVSTYISMVSAGVPPDNFAFPAVLKSAAALQDYHLGKQLHAHAVKHGYASSSVTVANTLVHLYGKCGDIGHAYLVFDRISERDQVSWNSMIAAACHFGEWALAIQLFQSMMVSGNAEPSSFTLVSLSLACSNLGRVIGSVLGKQVHGFSLRNGHVETFTVNALIAMYAKLGRLDDSRALFESFQDRDIVSWNTFISSLSQNHRYMEAMVWLQDMVLDGTKPDAVTIASVLPACTHLQMLDVGQQIHALSFKNKEIIHNSFVSSALVDMYCNCQLVESARKIFDSTSNRKIGLWNAMISGYAQNERDHDALKLFLEMEAVAGLCSNATTMASVLPACVRCEAFSNKESIHGHVIKKGLEKDRYVQNALMDMYARMGRLDIAENIFEDIEDNDTVSWNTLITAYVLSECHDKALYLLSQMHVVAEAANRREKDGDGERINYPKPNAVTLMTVLPGCAALSALSKGKEIHGYAIRNGLAAEVAVGSALVDMYAKCGCLKLAISTFDQLPVRNVITWNVIIMAYGMHGRGEEALHFFKRMVDGGSRGKVAAKPNEVTFIALFAACSHSGMVEEGLNLFYRMKDDHQVDQTPDHYACIVDLLGRAGRVVEAYDIIMAMPPEFDKTSAWSSLLGACRIHHKLEIGEIAATNLLELEPGVASHYVLLSNIYSSAGLWDKAMDVRKKMKEMGVRKEPGCSWIEYDNEVHKFIAGGSSHPQSERLHQFLDTLSDRMRKEGYVPDTSCVLHNVNEEEKESLLCGHSERLAIAFGILNTPPGTTIRVAKNLRVCNDCHSATKFISMMEKREIILRDVRRFHHFKEGKCSCGDYW